MAERSKKLGIETIQTYAGVWRRDMLYPREQRNAVIAKQTAIQLALKVIRKSGASAYNQPTDDAAEAILVGLWACVKLNWIDIDQIKIRN